MKKKYDSQSYENKKEMIKKNQENYKRLVFNLSPSEYKLFEKKAIEKNISKIDLFRSFLNLL